jgi:hypothetical protein
VADGGEMLTEGGRFTIRVAILEAATTLAASVTFAYMVYEPVDDELKVHV